MTNSAPARKDEEVRERENEQRCNRRLVPGVQENESTNKAVLRAKRTNDMACTNKNGEFRFGQPCGSWSIPCVQDCGYIHLSSSTPGTRKKYCANSSMSMNSNSCDSKMLAIFELREFPLFMRQAVSLSPEYCHHSLTYNNLFAMGATKVCNYSEDQDSKIEGLVLLVFICMENFIISSTLQIAPTIAAELDTLFLIMNQHLRLLLLLVIWTLPSWIYLQEASGR